MEGFISAYRLTGDIGMRIAEVKEMPIAWSNPNFLPNLFSNPGPLFIYDKLYLDQRSYEDLCDLLSKEEKKTLRAYVESPRLSIFELINAESVLTDEYVIQGIYQSFKELYADTQFVQTVWEIQSRKGNYARPTPLKFESMNIPVVELLCECWSSKVQKDLYIVDDVERALLFKISKQRTFSRNIIPEISKLVIDLIPKFFTILPHRDKWDIDAILKIRENEHLVDYRKKMDIIAKDATKALEQYLSTAELPERLPGHDYTSDILDELTKFFETLQSGIFDELDESYAKIENRLKVNRWSILGGIIACTGAVVSPICPPLGVGLGVLGGEMIVGEQISIYLKKRSYRWIEFLEFVSKKIRRQSIN